MGLRMNTRNLGFRHRLDAWYVHIEHSLYTTLSDIICGIKLLIAVIGIVQLARGHVALSLHEDLFAGTSTSPSAYALALYSGLWAFDGFDQANYVAGEMRNAEKNIPRAIHSSMFVVTVSVIHDSVPWPIGSNSP